jgi:splicing factor 3A subunit 2
LTLHANEASYLAHTQGKKHQQNLARRAAKISKDTSQNVVAAGAKRVVKKSGAVIPKIGIPEHYVFKVRHPETKQLGLLFILKYPRVGDGIQPRTRFMSALEQKVEVADMNYQYVLFAAEPYNTIAFKVPSKEIDKKDGMFFSDWNEKTRVFAVICFFMIF